MQSFDSNSSNPYGLRDGEVSSGTTIMAVSFPGGVVMGADSRTSAGGYVVNRVSDKVVPIHDRVFACRSGSAADTQAIVDYVKYYINAHVTEQNAPPRVATCANIMRKICYENKNNLSAGLICAGWDEHEGSQVYTINLGGTMVKGPFAVGGSGSGYIYGLIDANYRPDMTRQECIDFVKTAVAHAMARDGSSGGVVRLVIIEKDAVSKEVVMGNELPFMPWQL